MSFLVVKININIIKRIVVLIVLYYFENINLIIIISNFLLDTLAI